MSNKVVVALMDAMRAGSESAHIIYERALQVLAWTCMAERHEISQSLSLEVALGADDSQLGGMVADLSARNDVCDYAFKSLRGLRRDEFTTLRAGLQQCQRLRSQGLLSNLAEADLSVTGAGLARGIGMPAEVADLLMGLVVNLGDLTYCAWDSSGQLVARALKRGGQVHCDVQQTPTLTCLAGLIVGGKLTVDQTDPIAAPGPVAHGKLVKFRSAVAFPPIGQRYGLETAERDLFNRFYEKTTVASVLAIRHLLAMADSQVVVCIPNGFLFGANTERDLRRSLVDRGQIQAVIALPPGLLPSASIAISILVLSPTGGETSVRVINADDDRFRNMISKTRSMLTDVQALIEASTREPDTVISRDVPAEEIASNDYQLQVSRYLIADEQKRVLSALQGEKLTPLSKLVDIIRPPVVKAKGSTNAVLLEVGVADLPAYGFIKGLNRYIEVDDEMAAKLARCHLRPFDIVLAIKGSVGKIGLVSPEVNSSELPWIPGQSSVVLRAKSPNVDSRVLFMLLRSGLGQALMKSIVSTGTIPFIQTSQLELLSIPVPSVYEQARVIELLSNEELLQGQIDELQAQLAKQSQAVWPI